MSLNIIVGTRNKSKEMYLRVKACENSKKHALIFVPKSYKVSAEKEYISFLNVDGMIGTKITDIDTYISNILKRYNVYKEKNVLPEMAKKMCIKKCIKENEDIFKIYKTVKDTTGFVETIYNYIIKIETEKAFADIEEKDIQNLQLESNVLQEKIKEVYDIYRVYADSIKEKFVTSSDEKEIFISMIEKGLLDSELENIEIFIDNYNNFNETERALIKTLLLKNINVNITLDLDIEKKESLRTNIFDISYETYILLKDMAKENNIHVDIEDLNIAEKDIEYANNLAFLQENIFMIEAKKVDINTEKKDETVTIKVIDNPYKEIEYVASSIKSQVINKERRYKEFAVYSNNVEEYEQAIKSVFAKYDIPVYLDIKVDILNSNIYRYIKSMLEIFSAFPYKNMDYIFMYLKSCLSNIKNENIYLFENYVKEFGIYAYSLKKEFTKNNKEGTKNFVYDLEVLNEVRKNILNEFDTFKKQITATKVGDAYITKSLTTAVINYLETNGVIDRYNILLEQIKEVSEETYSKKVQILKEIYNVFDMIDLSYDSISIEDYINLFEYGIKNVTISTIPYMIDQVEIRNISKLSGDKRKKIYIIGTYDSMFPKQITPDAIFTDSELETLENNGIKFKQKSEYSNIKELFNIYKTIGKCEETLELTFPSSTTSGAALRPSYILNDIKEMLEITISGDITKSAIDNFLSNNMSLDVCFDSFLSMLTRYNELEIKEKIEVIAMYKFLENSGYKKYIDYFRNDDNLSKNILDKLYKDSINLSVSRLESFERCPFAYFAEYNLSVIKNKEYMISKLDLGSLMHKVLEQFTKYMIERNIDFSNAITSKADEEKINKKIDEIIENTFAINYSNFEDSNKSLFLKARIKSNMKRIIIAVLDSFRYSEFVPLGYEIEFEEGKLYAPIKIELENKTMYLVGKIDRVDIAKINDKVFVRIIDYKSSEKTLSLDLIRDKISLQLMTYMSAIIENKEKISKSQQVLPASINYFNITNKVLNLSEYETDDKLADTVKKSLKLKGIYINEIEILKSLDKNFEEPKKSYLDITSRMLSNKNKVLTQEEFANECKHIKQSLKEIGEEIIKGTVKIRPNRKIKDTCKYCEYRAMCRKDIKC